MDNKPTCYALVDPRDNRVYYVGQSIAPARRFQQHLSSINASVRQIETKGLEYIKYQCSPKQRWLLELRLLDLTPKLFILDSSRDEDGWIRHYLGLGHPIMNATTSGGGWGDTRVSMLEDKEQFPNKFSTEITDEVRAVASNDAIERRKRFKTRYGV